MSEPTPDEPVGWVTLPQAEGMWADAGELTADVLTDLLAAAHEQCMEFLGREPEPVKARHRIAQVLQARALARSTNAGAHDTLGPDGLTVTVFPMDWTVKNLLRPKRGLRGPR